jgi:hypothetical protein
MLTKKNKNNSNEIAFLYKKEHIIRLKGIKTAEK